MPVKEKPIIMPEVKDMPELKSEYDGIVEMEKEIKERKAEIKDLILEIANEVNPEKRVVLDAGEFGAFDRIVSRKGGDRLDFNLLEEFLGTEKFRRLCCVKTVSYVPSQEMVDAAVVEGKIDENVVESFTGKGAISYTLKSMTLAALEKLLGSK